ncbi:hypothetical protein VII_003487 [Vibrio mimicus MB451]|nr:hypothetical protein VII_003487 [Vibrio mimicus MB451]
MFFNGSVYKCNEPIYAGQDCERFPTTCSEQFDGNISL